MLKKTVIASESLPQELPTEFYPLPQSSAISDYSSIQGTPEHIRAWLMSLRQDGPVNHIASPGIDEEAKTIEICGQKQPKPFALLDPSGSWVKTCQGYFQLTMDGIGEAYSGTWPEWATLLHGECFQQLPLDCRTSDEECSLLPTPSHRDGKSFYVTTLNTSYKRIVLERGRHQIHWMQYSTLLHGLKKSWANPRFSEALMGWPIGWSDLAPLAMDKFQMWLEMRGSR